MDTEKYKQMVYRFIKFDDEMTLLTYKWREVWTLINHYHRDNVDVERRKRILMVHDMMKKIKMATITIDQQAFDEAKHTVGWVQTQDVRVQWAYAINVLRDKWMECAASRMVSNISNVQCLKCNFSPATHYV